MKNGKTRLTAGIYAMMFTSAVCTSAQGALLSDLIAGYRLESSSQGFMSAAQSIGNLCAVFLIGALVGRVRKRSLLAVTAVVIPCAYCLLGLHPAFAVLLAVFLIYGVVFGFLDSLASSMMVDLYRKASARYMNLLHGCYGVGGLAGPILIQRLRLSGLEWYRVMTVCGACAAAASLLYLSGMRSARGLENHSDKPERIVRDDIVRFFSEARKRLLLSCAFLYGAHQIGVTVWVTRYISEYLNAPQWGAPALSLFWLGVTASRLLLARFHIPRVKTVFLCNMLSAIIFAAGVLSGNGLVMMVCAGLTGCAEGVILPMSLDIACGWEESKTYLGSTLLLFAHYTGFIVSAPVVAYLIARFGIKSGMLLPAGLSLVAAFLARGLIPYDRILQGGNHAERSGDF